MADPTRDFPDREIEFSLQNWGGWFGWMGEQPEEAIRAIAWMASQGDELPDELKSPRDAIASFGHAPVEEAVQRVQGLEKAFAEIEEIMDAPGGVASERIRTIVEMCVKFSGGFGPVELGIVGLEEETTDA